MHVIQRGHNRQICFTSDTDVANYAHFLTGAAGECLVDIHGWVFMTNHVHLLVTPRKDGGVSRMMQQLGRLYARRFNYIYSRSGALFEDRFKSSVIEDSAYLFTCLRYIELNPVRAGIVADPGAYRWSSYSAHGLGKPVEMWTPHALYLELGVTSDERQARYRDLIAESLGADAIERIRHCTNKGLILGSEQFRKQFAQLTGETNTWLTLTPDSDS